MGLHFGCLFNGEVSEKDLSPGEMMVGGFREE